jgi:hypothetical protein
MQTPGTDDVLMCLLLAAMLVFVAGIGIDAHGARVQAAGQVLVARLDGAAAALVHTVHRGLPVHVVSL